MQKLVHITDEYNNISSSINISIFIIKRKQCGSSTRGGGLPYEEYMGVCHELGSYFQEKIPKRVCQFFTKIPERVKKFQVGLVILIPQKTNQKKTALTDYFHPVWTKNPQF